MSNKSSPAPFRIVGSLAGKPVFLRSQGNRVILSYQGIDKSFPTRDAALLYLQGETIKQKDRGK